MTKCVVCGKDLRDPKNCGDPDENGEWVCANSRCRVTHDTPMTVQRVVTRTTGTAENTED